MFIEQKDNVLTLNLAKARDAINNKKLHYAVDFDKGIFQFLPSEDDNPSSCEDLRDEYDGVATGGDDVF